jgi:hypothetical protein
MSRIALVMAALLAFLTIAAGAMHHHASGSDAVRVECRMCAWVHSASASLHVSTPAPVAFAGVPVPAPAEREFHAQLPLSPHSGRAPPVSSL